MFNSSVGYNQSMVMEKLFEQDVLAAVCVQHLELKHNAANLLLCDTDGQWASPHLSDFADGFLCEQRKGKRGSCVTSKVSNAFAESLLRQVVKTDRGSLNHIDRCDPYSGLALDSLKERVAKYFFKAITFSYIPFWPKSYYETQIHL